MGSVRALRGPVLHAALLASVVLGGLPAASVALAGEAAKLEPEMAAAIGEAIRAAGLPCPAAKYAYPREAEPFGAFLRVHCGPTDQPGTSPRAIYRVHLANGIVSRVEPWPEWHGQRN